MCSPLTVVEESAELSDATAFPSIDISTSGLVELIASKVKLMTLILSPLRLLPSVI